MCIIYKAQIIYYGAHAVGRPVVCGGRKVWQVATLQCFTAGSLSLNDLLLPTVQMSYRTCSLYCFSLCTAAVPESLTWSMLGLSCNDFMNFPPSVSHSVFAFSFRVRPDPNRQMRTQSLTEWKDTDGINVNKMEGNSIISSLFWF